MESRRVVLLPASSWAARERVLGPGVKPITITRKALLVTGYGVDALPFKERPMVVIVERSSETLPATLTWDWETMAPLTGSATVNAGATVSGTANETERLWLVRLPAASWTMKERLLVPTARPKTSKSKALLVTGQTWGGPLFSRASTAGVPGRSSEALPLTCTLFVDTVSRSRGCVISRKGATISCGGVDTASRK